MSRCFFKSRNPSGANLNALGCYLLISLFFVIATMIEFAVVLVIKRRLEWIPKNTTRQGFDLTANQRWRNRFSGIRNRKLLPINTMESHSNNYYNASLDISIMKPNKHQLIGSNWMISSVTEAIDFVSFITFSVSYLLFHCVYYATYM